MVFAVLAETIMLTLFFVVPQVAAVLHHQVPPIIGVVCALLAIPAVWMVDAAYKARTGLIRDHARQSF